MATVRVAQILKSHEHRRCVTSNHKNIIACVTQTIKNIEHRRCVSSNQVQLFYFYEKSVKKSSFGGPGGSAQNPRKNGPKHTFFLLHRRKIGQKVVKTWSESRGILIFQEGAFFRFFAKNLTSVGAPHARRVSSMQHDL